MPNRLFSWSGCLLLLCLLVAAPVLGRAADVVVVSVKGKTEYRAAETAPWQALGKDVKLGVNASVRTYEGGEAVLSVGSRGVVTVHELSTLVVRRLDGPNEAPQSTFSLLVGMIWNRWKKAEEGAKDNSEMIIETPAAIASIRGTSFYVESDETTKDARVGVWNGRVAVVPARLKDRERMVEPGFEIIVLYNKLLVDPVKMEVEHIKREQQFNEEIESLGLAALFPATKGIAEINKVLVDEAETTIKTANAQQRGEAIVRADFVKIKEALAKLYADTEFLPGAGANKAAGKKTLLCLTVNDDGKGGKIDGWKGPYMDTDYKDPFGNEYTVYQKKVGNSVILMLSSLGLDKVVSDDDVEVPYSTRSLAEDAKKQ